MTSNEYIGLSHVQKKTVNGKETKGWITVGVIASKTETKRSAVCILQIHYLMYTSHIQYCFWYHISIKGFRYC